VTTEPYAPSPNTVLVRTYEVQAAIVYPEDTGAVNLTLTGEMNTGGEPAAVHVTLTPETALALSRDLRQAFLRVPLEKRHERS
jgi:hypothetical protein